ncbi:CHASE4 domain-containing protein [Methanosarcina sp. Z-7115]|uniref:histidine kinase n=1 Tax=Methanosarcina baikalica TaxID=3073890 RepID=A0ABU2D1M5_9EURY|nr:CHASE4 domain-containing protein [Methanosarcina sp. Z-7115]MDR7665884.1 CHASE4 domain-containing protein [Methanosarcina sp. Z-7115]
MQLSNFLELEQTTTLQDVGRVQNAVSTQQGYLDYINQDWAYWNDTYNFIEDRNQNYSNVNLQNQTLAGIKVNVMLFVNNSGSLVYAKSVDLYTGKEKPIPEKLLKMIEDGTLRSKSENDKKSGFVLLDENPMFISCHPILTTNYTGPMRGTLIFGKYFDDTLLNNFKETTRSSLLMYRVDREMPPDFQIKLDDLSENPDRTIVEPLSEDKIAGYFELRDISGNSALILRADFPRELYLNGEKTLNNMYFFLLLTGLMTGVGVKFALDRLFISRLIGIDNFVTRVRSEKDLSKRLSLKNNDELYRLSKEINGMLNEINLVEQELKAQEREKKVLLDSLNELVIFVNPQLNIIWANKAALEYMQISLEKAVGIYFKATSEIDDPLSDNLQLEQIFVTGNKKSGEFTAKDGRVWFIQAIPVTGEDGRIIGVMETCRDITERKAAEKFLQEKQIAEAANRTKSEFLANMSHELRTPLNSIIGFSDLLYEQAYGELSEKQLRSVGNISKSGKHLLNLINNILDLSKVEAGKLELDYKEFELASKLNMIKNLLSPIADRKSIQIEIDMDSNLTSVCADEARFVQVMHNLVDNAIKFSYENGLVKIGARKKGDMVEIMVKDTGIGIKVEDQDKLFKPFSQVDSFFSKQFQGTGLGLSLVKQIVNLHGGYVWFRSNQEEGTTFAFTIPIKGNK